MRIEDVLTDPVAARVVYEIAYDEVFSPAEVQRVRDVADAAVGSLPHPEKAKPWQDLADEVVQAMQKKALALRKAKADENTMRFTSARVSYELDKVLGLLVPDPSPDDELVATIRRFKDSIENALRDAPSLSDGERASWLGAVQAQVAYVAVAERQAIDPLWAQRGKNLTAG